MTVTVMSPGVQHEPCHTAQSLALAHGNMFGNICVDIVEANKCIGDGAQASDWAIVQLAGLQCWAVQPLDCKSQTTSMWSLHSFAITTVRMSLSPREAIVRTTISAPV